MSMKQSMSVLIVFFAAFCILCCFFVDAFLAMLLSEA